MVLGDSDLNLGAVVSEASAGADPSFTANRMNLISSTRSAFVRPSPNPDSQATPRPNLLLQTVWVNAKKVVWYVSVPFVKYSHILAMAGLYFSGLTSVNLVNAGYVLFFLFAVIVRRKVLQKSWLVLILYCELAISIIYLWQTSWTAQYDDNYWVKMCGTRSFPPREYIYILNVFSSCRFEALRESVGAPLGRQFEHGLGVALCHSRLFTRPAQPREGISSQSHYYVFSLSPHRFSLRLDYVAKRPILCIGAYLSG